MPRLTVHLLSSPRLERDGVPLEVNTRKAIALLAYLALEPGHHSRERLAALFWPEYDQAHARAALRSTLWTLNKVLGRTALKIDRETVGLDRNAGPSTLLAVAGQALWLDVDHFHSRLAECRAHGHSSDDVCAECLTVLAEAAALYHDDLLAGFTLRDSPDFEEWRFFQSESLRRELTGALEKLARGHSARREFEPAIAYARRWLALDPLHEPAHRLLMQVYTWTGQRAAALQQYAECAQRLERELGVPAQDETTRLYEAIKQNLAPPLPVTPVSFARPLSGNLAAHAPPTPFIGREEELAEIARLLENADCRLLTIVGPGGIGKTRLAFQAALAHGAVFNHGVYFVPLAPVSSIDFLVPAIAESLAFQFFGQQDPRTQLLNYLRAKNLLLVMDNFEHLLSPAASGEEQRGVGLLLDILESAPGVKLLVTSRERLNHPGEWLLDIQGLRFPEAVTDGADIENYSAVQLFLHSARRVHWSFALSEAEKPGVLRICRLVEGMPLGVELAAAWVRVISPAEIAQEIERDLGFLATSLGGVPERHRSLRAVFDYSWKRLSEEAKSVFRRLSVFHGGFDRAAAEQVVGASLLNLSTLVDHSFLHRTPSGRYAVHELLRQYAEHELQADTQENEETRNRHCVYYADFLHQRETHLKGVGQREALESIGVEIENVRAGGQRAIAAGKAEAIVKSRESLFIFYRLRSHFQEGAAAFAQMARALAGVEPGVLLGDILARQGVFAELLGRFNEARELLHKSLNLLRSSPPDTRRELAFALRQLGTIAYRQAEYAEARQLFRESLALYQAVDDQDGIAQALSSLGLLAIDLGEYAEAKQALQESLALYRLGGDRFETARLLNSLGILTAQSEGYTEAKQFFHESIALRREIDDKYGVASALSNLGILAEIQGEFAEAKQLASDSLAIRREVGDRFTIAICLNNLSSIARRMGEHEEAKQLAQEGLAIRREIGDRRGIASALSNLGQATTALGEYQESRKHFREALRIGMEIRATPLILDILTGLADLLAKEGKVEQAWELLNLARQHPATENQVKDRAAHLLAELESQLPSQVIAAARARGAAGKLEQMVEKALSSN